MKFQKWVALVQWCGVWFLACNMVVHGGTKEQTFCKEVSEAEDSSLREESFGMFLVKILSKSPVKATAL